MESGLLLNSSGASVLAFDTAGKGSWIDGLESIDAMAFAQDVFETAQGHGASMSCGMAMGLALPSGGVGFGHS